MKILLISPVRNPDKKTPKGQMMPQLALYILEGLTPEQHEIKIVEEECDTVDVEESYDLVAISCMTSNAPRAYYLADIFRQRGVPVVIGGVHPTLLPHEAKKHADAVAVGEAEGIWQTILEDAENKELKDFYHVPEPSLDPYIELRELNKQPKGLLTMPVCPMMTTRGCPYECEFCSVKDIFGKRIRHNPVENVIRAIKDSNAKRFMFLDDNIIGKPRYAKELFTAIKPLKIKWVGQASISFVGDSEMMKLAKESGCEALFFGMESVSEKQLKRMKKSIKQIEDVKIAIKKVKDIGIHFHGSFVFGFDTDEPSIFEETVEFVQKVGIPSATFNVLTPYPGTAIYGQFKKEGRLLTHNWLCYDHNTVVYSPLNMTPYELQKGRDWAETEFTKFSMLFKRFPSNMKKPIYFWAVNLGSHGKVRKKSDKLERLEKMYGDKLHKSFKEQ